MALSVFVFFMASTVVFGGTDRYTIDPTHSTVGFSIRHLFGKVPGKFDKFSGTLTGDVANPAMSSVTATINAAGINTGVAARDEDLRSDNFFDAAKYPAITFESKKVTVKSPTNIIVTGDLAIHGITKSVDIDVELLGSGADPWGGYRASFEGKLTINRKDFGIIYNKVLDTGGTLVGDTVDILLDIEAIKEKALAATH